MTPTAEPNVAIRISGLTKSYGPVQALRGIDLEVNRGEVFGFLGPNGAGKTTTIRCLLDMIRPTSGSLRILGIDPQVDSIAVRQRVGYLPGELHLDDNLTARQVLQLFNALRDGRADWGYTQSLAERLQLDLDRPIKQFSKGNKQKVGVVQAFMHQPELLLLDEPSSGLDPLMQQQVLGLVREAYERGATVFFSSHILSEVESACARVGIVRQGRVVDMTDPRRLSSRNFRYLTVKLRQAADGHALAALAGVHDLRKESECQFRCRVEGDMGRVLLALAQLPVQDIDIERPSLEELFLAYYEAKP